MKRRLADRLSSLGDYSIADMAHSACGQALRNQGQDLDDFPNSSAGSKTMSPVWQWPRVLRSASKFPQRRRLNKDAQKVCLGTDAQVIQFRKLPGKTNTRAGLASAAWFIGRSEVKGPTARASTWNAQRTL